MEYVDIARRYNLFMTAGARVIKVLGDGTEIEPDAVLYYGGDSARCLSALHNALRFSAGIITTFISFFRHS